MLSVFQFAFLYDENTILHFNLIMEIIKYK